MDEFSAPTREQIRAGFTQAWGSVPKPPLTGVRDLRVHDTADPEVIISEHEVDAVNPRPGRRSSHRFLLVLRARDGEIVHLHDYADMLRVSAGLGRLPQLFDQLRTDPRPIRHLRATSPANDVPLCGGQARGCPARRCGTCRADRAA